MGAIMFGNGLSGIATNLLKVLFMLIFPTDSNLSKSAKTNLDIQFKVGLIYFISCAIFMLGSGFLFDVLNKNEYYVFQKKQSLKDKPISLPEGSEIPNSNGVSPMLEKRIE